MLDGVLVVCDHPNGDHVPEVSGVATDHHPQVQVTKKSCFFWPGEEVPKVSLCCKVVYQDLTGLYLI